MLFEGNAFFLRAATAKMRLFSLEARYSAHYRCYTPAAKFAVDDWSGAETACRPEVALGLFALRGALCHAFPRPAFVRKLSVSPG